MSSEDSRTVYRRSRRQRTFVLPAEQRENPSLYRCRKSARYDHRIIARFFIQSVERGPQNGQTRSIPAPNLVQNPKRRDDRAHQSAVSVGEGAVPRHSYIVDIVLKDLEHAWLLTPVKQAECLAGDARVVAGVCLEDLAGPIPVIAEFFFGELAEQLVDRVPPGVWVGSHQRLVREVGQVAQ